MFEPDREMPSSKRCMPQAPVDLGILLNNLPGMAYRCLNNAAWEMKFVSRGCKDLTGYEQGDLLNNQEYCLCGHHSSGRSQICLGRGAKSVG